MKKFIISLLVLAVFFISTSVFGQYFEDEEYDVPYVPTKYEIVEKMLKMANVNKKDILYDLGCGDGRIVITAAKKYGARGFGIDINPVRIEESNENAVKEGVTDKVRFIEQNLFESDISKATVLTLYLLQSVNLKLRPKLFLYLKPGTRIVSHDFDMGEWEPDQSTVIGMDFGTQSSFGNDTVYLWILPTNVSGNWEVKVSDKNNNNSYILHIEQKFQKLNGNLTDKRYNISIKSIKIEGDRLQFTTEEEIESEKVTGLYEGKVDNNKIEGKVIVKSNSFSDKGSWEAKRDPSTIIPIDPIPDTKPEECIQN